MHFDGTLTIEVFESQSNGEYKIASDAKSRNEKSVTLEEILLGFQKISIQGMNDLPSVRLEEIVQHSSSSLQVQAL